MTRRPLIGHRLKMNIFYRCVYTFPDDMSLHMMEWVSSGNRRLKAFQVSDVFIGINV